MKVKILSDITSWKNYRDLEAGKVYEIPLEDAQKLVQGGQAAEVIEEFLGEGTRKRVEAETRRPTLADYLPEGPAPEEKRAEIDPGLRSWLVEEGFVCGPEGVAYTKTDKVGEDTVKLQIDFSDDPRGMRYGYRLDLQSDPPEWKPDRALRDHPTLLEYKRFRDDLLAPRESRVQTPQGSPKPTEVPSGGGTKLALLPPEVEEAEEMEHRDEQMIIRELKGDLKVLERALADYFYSFELRGRRVIGLSYAGVKAIIRRMGHIEIIEIKVEEKPNSWFVLVKARDKLKDLEAYGAAIQPKQFLGGGENPFALTVAVSKAQRNAWRHFIDEKVVTETYRAWLEGRGR